MRGRGRGRGGFSAISFKNTYIYNPNCEDTPILTDTEKELVLFNRLLKRFANESEDYVAVAAEPKLIQSFEDNYQTQITSPDKQRRLLIEPIGPQYFPDELLGSSFNPNRQRIGMTKTVNWAKFQGNADGGDDKADSLQSSEPEEEDFGGEDYGLDHNADEDREDEFQDGSDMGGDD